MEKRAADQACFFTDGSLPSIQRCYWVRLHIFYNCEFLSYQLPDLKKRGLASKKMIFSH
jgi:hypothetical protein